MNENKQFISIAISMVALFISFLTFWLTRLKKGKVKMTRPTTIYFGPDKGDERNKVYIRTLLYSTSDRGQYIQNMFIRLTRGEVAQNFNIWVYGDDKLMRGSGLFIERKGVLANNHFLLPKNNGNYNFLEGEYNLEVYIEPLNTKPIKIFAEKLKVSKAEQDTLLENKRAGIFFDWATNNQNYISHIQTAPFTLEELHKLIV